MDFVEMLGFALPAVYAVVGLALIWFIIELVMTLRKTRKTVTELQGQIEPVLESVNRVTTDLEPTVKSIERMTAQLEPAVAKVDPLVDRVTLTVDAANLEIMRIDQILEDVSQITDSVSSAVDTVDTVTSAPLELVSSVTDKVRAKMHPHAASKESVGLGAAKEGETASPVRELVDAAADVVGAAVKSVRGAGK